MGEVRYEAGHFRNGEAYIFFILVLSFMKMGLIYQVAT